MKMKLSPVLLPLLSLSTLLSLMGALVGQDPKPAGHILGDYEVKLAAETEIVLSNKSATVGLILTVNVSKDTEVDATLITGYDFRTTVDGRPGPALEKKVEGKVKLVAGTKIERRITFEIARVVQQADPTSLMRVSFEWPGFLGASVVISVAPDTKSVDISKLDLEKTRVLLVTNYGNLLLKFRPDKAPETVKNFVKLAKDGFYDGTKFHRILRGFMIQGGCPNTKAGALGRPGTGDPGYKLKAEFNDIRHVRGVLSMARGGHPDSAGCQFFIMHAANPGLDEKYTAFGELVTGLDTLDKIASVAVGGPQGSAPLEPVHLKMAIVQPVFK